MSTCTVSLWISVSCAHVLLLTLMEENGETTHDFSSHMIEVENEELYMM